MKMAKKKQLPVHPNSAPRPKEALQRLVQLYEETNRPELAAKLKKEFEPSNAPASK
jgi:hypothetical protein